MKTPMIKFEIEIEERWAKLYQRAARDEAMIVLLRQIHRQLLRQIYFEFYSVLYSELGSELFRLIYRLIEPDFTLGFRKFDDLLSCHFLGINLLEIKQGKNYH